MAQEIKGSWDNWTNRLEQKYCHAGFIPAEAVILARTDDKRDMFQQGIDVETAFQLEMEYRDFIVERGDDVGDIPFLNAPCLN